MSDETTAEGDVEGLPFGERFLLWALRHWVKAYRTDGDVRGKLAQGFRLAGIHDGSPAVNELMTMVAVGAWTRIDVRCPLCASVSPDEELFLGLVASLQRDDAAAARRILSCWLTPAGVRLAEEPATRLAQLLLRGGALLRPRLLQYPAQGAERPRAPLAAAPTETSATLH